jgi:hypothetical protein
MLRHRALALSVGVVLGTVSVSKANLIAYEPFGYSAGSNVTSTANPDTGAFGFASNDYSAVAGETSGSNNVASGNLVPTASPPGYAEAGNQLSINNNSASSGYEINNLFNPTAAGEVPAQGGTGTLYISYDMKASVLGGAAFFQLLSSSGVAAQFGFNIGTHGNDWFMNLGGTPTTPATTSSTFFVIQLNYGGGASLDSASFFINPTSSSSTASESTSGLTLPTLTGIQFAGINGTNLTINFDEVRVGNSFGDVVPEPASIGLVGAVGAMGLLRRRRNRTV